MMDKDQAYRVLCEQEDNGRLLGNQFAQLSAWLDSCGISDTTIADVEECLEDIDDGIKPNPVARSLRMELTEEELILFAQYLQNN
jgi:hypothetical protein